MVSSSRMKLPSVAFSAAAAAIDLKDAHDRISILGKPDSMNLNDARIAVISEFKASYSI